MSSRPSCSRRALAVAAADAVKVTPWVAAPGSVGSAAVIALPRFCCVPPVPVAYNQPEVLLVPGATAMMAHLNASRHDYGEQVDVSWPREVPAPHEDRTRREQRR